MAIPNYLHPQLIIKQQLARTTAATLARSNPVVIGPQYLLSRYGKETVQATAFNASGQNLSYTYADGSSFSALSAVTHALDVDSVKVQGVGLEASLVTFPTGGTNKFYLLGASEPNVIYLDGANVAGSGLDTTLRSRPVTVGDIVYVTDGVSASARKRKVTALRGTTVAATYGGNTAGTDGNQANSGYNPITDNPVTGDNPVIVSSQAGSTLTVVDVTDFNGLERGALFGGRYGEKFTITCRTGGAPATATFDISSASGLYSATNVASTNNAGDWVITDSNAGGELAGIDINIEATTVAQGDTWVFEVYGPYARLSVTQLDVTDGGDNYTGPEDTTYLLEVIEGQSGVGALGVTGAVIRISDTAGLEDVEEVTLTDNTNFDLGSYGLVAKFNFTSAPVQAGLRKGDVYYVHAKAATESTTNFDKVVLDGPAADTILFNVADPLLVEFRLPFTGDIPADEASDGVAWAADTTDVTVDPTLALYVDERATGYQWVSYVTAVGTLSVSYRAAKKASATETRISITSTSDITTNLGTIDIENELAFGANEMLSGGQGIRIFAVRTNGGTLADFAAALKKLESSDTIYALSPLTTDQDIMIAVKNHCEAMSLPTKKNFRRCYVSTDSPGRYLYRDVDDEDANILATIGDYAGENVLLTTPNADIDFTELNLHEDDIIELVTSGDEYEVFEVLSANEILLKAGPVSPVSPAVQIRIYKADTSTNNSEFVINRSQALNSRRACNVWCEGGTRLIGSDLVTIPSRFLACEIAGLRCASLPQQGLTNFEVKGVTDASAMYTRYTPDELDTIASNGVWIITQDVESGTIFNRHQLTTDSSNGSLYYEDSVGVNLDNISYQFKDRFSPYIGKNNVTSRFLQRLRSEAFDILNSATQADLDLEIGPQLNGFDNLTVEPDATQKDTINIGGDLLMPIPGNTIVVDLNAVLDLAQTIQ